MWGLQGNVPPEGVSLLVSFQGTASGRGAAWEVGGLAGVSGVPPTPRRAGKPPPGSLGKVQPPLLGRIVLPKGLCAPHVLVLSVSLSGDLSLPPRPVGGAWSGRRGRGDHHGGHICVPSWPPLLANKPFRAKKMLLV